MTWTSFHRRGEILRDVITSANRRRDGRLPMDLPGVAETFGDELSLVAALQLRWHTRLSGHLEHALMRHPADAAEAVLGAWHATADELPGTRLVLDRYRDQPIDQGMAGALRTAAAKEHVLLAAMAGCAGATTEATAAAGRGLEDAARAKHRAHVAA